MSVELQDIFAAHGQDYAETHRLTLVQLKALRDITACRTEDMGFHTDICPHCGYERITYNSCRNRHCPKCQTFTKEQWLEKQRQNLLDVSYFHAVFTVPAELNSVFMAHPEQMYNLLFKASAETVRQLCSQEKYLGAIPGMTAVLHTWGQNLCYHPHVHMLITGGGLTPYQTWKSTGDKFFLPVRVMSAVFRGKLMDGLKSLDFAEVDASLIDSCYSIDWNVYCKPPFENARKVLDYLGRYTHRVAISNSRIEALTDGKVTFRYRDYADGNTEKRMTLSADEFIRRFLLHILPKGLRKIRHYGLFASRNKFTRLRVCRWLTRSAEPAPPLTTRELLVKLFGPDFDLCPHCRIGRFSRDPPFTA